MAKIVTATQAAELVSSNATVMFGGFVGCGAALEVTDAIAAGEAKNLKAIINDASLVEAPDGRGHYGWAKLFHTGQITSYVGSHLGTNCEASQQCA